MNNIILTLNTLNRISLVSFGINLFSLSDLVKFGFISNSHYKNNLLLLCILSILPLITQKVFQNS